MPRKKNTTPGTPGRQATDGIKQARRRNLSLDDDTWDKLNALAGGRGNASAWVRNAVRSGWAASGSTKPKT